MVIHPPMLYMGYVGFSVAFAFAVAALISGRLDAAWARWSRPWTTAAWSFLTLGIALGSAWAYYELGWGGWWFWDPVENASFMPWLVGTALIHSLAVTEKRGGVPQLDRAARHRRVRACRSSAPSSCARACSPRCTPSRSTRSAGVFILALSRAHDRRRARALRLAHRAHRSRRRLRPGIARIPAAREQRAARRRRRHGVPRHAVSARARCAGRGQDFGGTAILRGGVRAAHGAGALSHGNRPARALEARKPSRARRAPALGARGEPRARRDPAFRVRPMERTRRIRPHARRLGCRHALFSA